MKKIILNAFITTALIGATFAEDSHFSGFYAGGGLNYTNEKSIFKGTTKLVGGASNEGNNSDSSKGGGVKLFGGYGTIISQGFYIGGELALGLDRLIGAKDYKKVKSITKFNYSLAGRIGYVISSFLPYVKFGYEGRPSIEIGDLISIKRNGFILGGGVDFSVTKNVFIRGEYLHGFGTKSNKSLNGATGTAALNFKTSSDTFLIGSAYKF